MSIITPLRPDALTCVQSRIDGSAMFQWLGIKAEIEENALLYRLTFREDHIGNPILRALHGGVISSLLESCAQLEITAREADSVRLQPVSVHTSYFTSSLPEDMMVRATVRRLGRRFAFLECDGWQKDETSPVARSAIGLRVLR